MCYNHNTNILIDDNYPLMESYMYLILSQRQMDMQKIQLFDIGKKLIIKYNINSLDAIMTKLIIIISVFQIYVL